jgi:hypothetical protein
MVIDFGLDLVGGAKHLSVLVLKLCSSFLAIVCPLLLDRYPLFGFLLYITRTHRDGAGWRVYGSSSSTGWRMIIYTPCTTVGMVGYGYGYGYGWCSEVVLVHDIPHF